MTTPLVAIPMHASACATDFVENSGRAPEARAIRAPEYIMPGRDPKDTLVNPMAALGRYNPYTKVVTDDRNVMTWMNPQPYTQPEQVWMHLSNTFGSTGNYQTPPLYSSNPGSTSQYAQWNSVMTLPSQRKEENYSLDGRPTRSRLRKLLAEDMLPQDFVWRPGFDENRPTADDFEQSMNIKVNPGADDSFTPGEACSCKVDLSRGPATVQMIAMSSANYEMLYKMMREADLLGPIEKLVIFEGRSIPCLCSWITGTYASAFAGFTQNMIQPAINEPDIKITLASINQSFIQRIVGNYSSMLKKRQLNQYKRFMGPTAGFTLPPMDPALQPGLSEKQVEDNIGELSATNYQKIDGAKLFGSLDTFAYAHSASKPRIPGWTDDLYLLTGIDARAQEALVKSGAVTTGLQPSVDVPLATRIVNEVKGLGDAKLFSMGIPLE